MNGCGCGNDSFLWIIILLSCCGGSGLGGNSCGNGNDSSCLWILILLFCCGGLGSNQLGNCGTC
ncbi:MAG: chorion class high-cysteine HCB protein 13 [Anaerotignum sp.]